MDRDTLAGESEPREEPAGRDASKRVARPRRRLPVLGADAEEAAASAGPGARAGEQAGPGSRPHGLEPGVAGPRPVAEDRTAASRHPSAAPPLEGVRHVVAVSSGKGGVGKSTVSVNLAATWAAGGKRVGLMDADIYGPDIPAMFGLHEKPRMSDQLVVPLEAHGVKLMSLGFLVEEDTPAIWRGPIVMGIVRQFLHQVSWGELDYLLVDLPPGTGDAQLSLCQLVRVSGAVMVTTPQDVAVSGVLKGIRMFQKVEVPVLGLVENMRGFACPGCGEVHEIFGSGGGEKLAAALEVPFLGSVPLGMAVREAGDRGMPTVVSAPDSPEGKAFAAVAGATAERIRERAASTVAG
ncbi:MAG: Mrp/NBP35 family ATP-binding protein [Gemmatimonadota bacterium]